MKSKERPYILYVAEVIYSEISRIKKNNPDLSNINAIENFIGSNLYKEISSGKFHEEWFKELKKITTLIKIQKTKSQKKH